MRRTSRAYLTRPTLRYRALGRVLLSIKLNGVQNKHDDLSVFDQSRLSS